MKFVKTQDEETARKLIAENYVLVSHDSNVWTFMNNPDKVMNFASNKIFFSNTLTF